MKTGEIKALVRSLPSEQRKQLGNQATKYALRQWQTWVAFILYLIVMIIAQVIGGILGFSSKPISVAFCIGVGIGIPIFVCTLEHQRRKSIVRALDSFQQTHEAKRKN
ncbi:MAG: hypothetical protein KAS69_05360 [Planctomycetes bacterium]|nr:hypothetical protein [Planctomycetota bacterium]